MSAAICAVSCNLEFQPTDSGSGEDLLKSATTAVTIVDGIYRTMWTAGWSTGGNAHQCFGISAYNIALESMADDFIMQSQGNGGFWYDHCYNVKSFYTSDSFRPYDVWNANYTWISNANYVISAEKTMTGSEVDVDYVLGNAYAIRAPVIFQSGELVRPSAFTAHCRKSSVGQTLACRSTPSLPARISSARSVRTLRQSSHRSTQTLTRPSICSKKVTRLSSEAQNPIFPIMSPSASRLV